MGVEIGDDVIVVNKKSAIYSCQFDWPYPSIGKVVAGKIYFSNLPILVEFNTNRSIVRVAFTEEELQVINLKIKEILV